jgi:Helix-turn-helix domain of resolvase/LAGLIDADG-like domain
MATNKLSKEDIKEVIDLYTNKEIPIKQIADKFNCSYVNIRLILKRRSLIKVNPKHKLTKNPRLDLNLFTSIDSAFKAYLFGLITADGYVSKLNIELSLQEKDRELLEKIRVKLNLDTNLIFKPLKAPRQNVYRLYICSKAIVQQLNNLGLSGNKTKDLNGDILKNIPDKFFSHFVRGFFDGDGCISHSNNDYTIGFIGTESFITALKNKLEVTTGVHFSLSKHSTTSYIRTITVSGRYQCISFAKWMYKYSVMHMHRKYQKYIELLASEIENPFGKLKLSDYDKIIKLYSTGKYTYVSLAEKFNISSKHVARIVKGYRPISR